MNRTYVVKAARCGLVVMTLLLTACFGRQVFPLSDEHVISLKTGDLERAGLAFITPSSATGQEEEKQAVALVFAEVMKRERPQVRIVALAEALSAINRVGLAESYKRMYDDYRDTGLFNRETLARVRDATGARYVAQIKLQGFHQGAKERFGALGLRIVETHYVNVRLFLQIWDAGDGSIAWEGMQEMVYSRDRVREEPVTLHAALQESARAMIRRLP